MSVAAGGTLPKGTVTEGGHFTTGGASSAPVETRLTLSTIDPSPPAMLSMNRSRVRSELAETVKVFSDHSPSGGVVRVAIATPSHSTVRPANFASPLEEV